MPNQMTIEEITYQDAPPSIQTVLGESKAARLLRFKNAVYARVEKNRNQDRIDENVANALAATLANKPIDVEHDLKRILGYYDAGRFDASEGVVYSDGFVFADRFPVEARGFMTGEFQQSLEAVAEKAECSVCHDVFASENKYCVHLKARLMDRKAERILHGVVATGGALTRKPAGTNTTANPDQIEMIAHVVEAEAEPTPSEIVVDDSSEASNAFIANILSGRWTNTFTDDGGNPTYYQNPYPVFSPHQYVQDPEFLKQLTDSVTASVVAELKKLLPPPPEPAPTSPVMASEAPTPPKRMGLGVSTDQAPATQTKLRVVLE